MVLNVPNNLMTKSDFNFNKISFSVKTCLITSRPFIGSKFSFQGIVKNFAEIFENFCSRARNPESQQSNVKNGFLKFEVLTIENGLRKFCPYILRDAKGFQPKMETGYPVNMFI